MSHTSSLFARRSLLLAGAALALPCLGRSRPSPAAFEGALAPQLAAVYARQVDPALCWVSEKYDGVRALWDGARLRHRSGRTVSAPAAFLAALPAEPLDGELWLGRGRFEPLSALVRRVEPREADWRDVRYMVFDMPVAALPFETRLRRLAQLGNTPRSAVGNARSAQVENGPRSPIEIAPQWRVADDAALQRDLARTVAGGGEGLVLHVANAPYTPGRSDSLLKLKPHLDAEAVVVGHRRGSGKYGAEVGALEVENAEGRRFFVGSGLSDAARRRPPPIGSTITYRYRDLTSSGLPRFATYLRGRDPW